MKINNFRGDLTDISSKNEALILTDVSLTESQFVVNMAFNTVPDVASFCNRSGQRVCFQNGIKYFSDTSIL